MKPPERSSLGQAGVEVLGLAAVASVMLILLVANAWAVVEAKSRAEVAARHGARAVAERAARPHAWAQAEAEAVALFEAGGGSAEWIGMALIDGSLRRCQTVVVEVRARVPAVGLGKLFPAATTVTGRSSSLVDPLAHGLAPDPSPCP
ncbi:MAG: hypothetical protein ACT4OS_10615 [Acidimicrobiales bacterium]